MTGSNRRPPRCKRDALPLNHRALHLSVCYVGTTPNILTVCNGVRHNFRCEYPKGVCPISGTLVGTSQVPDSPGRIRTCDQTINSRQSSTAEIHRGIYVSKDKRMTGIEPVTPTWKDGMLLLHHIRNENNIIYFSSYVNPYFSRISGEYCSGETIFFSLLFFSSRS